MLKDQEDRGCCACWARFFKKKSKNPEAIRLIHPSASHDLSEQIEVGDVEQCFQEGKVMWDKYISNQQDINFDDEESYEQLAQNPFLITCYKRLRYAANDGHKAAIEYVDKFPGKLRLELDRQLPQALVGL